MTEREIFVAAFEIGDAAARDAYLDRACEAEPALRRRVAGLLDALGRAGPFLQGPAAVGDAASTRGSAADAPAEGPGAVVGPYELLEAIGEGGMGVVFVAEQTRPVHRTVALKVIKPGMDTRQVVARFEAERQALALMDHPNIARVLDAGATDAGRPYFVMELVRGLPITDYCDQARLSIPDRLALFVSVCRAVQHAHQKGVIHRDLKPSNVLVTVVDGRPVPKVIDFGVAKAVGGALTDRTLHTGHLQLVGTPLYMSPEQAELSGVDVDTRSDVYSLGVLLYEILTGSTPFGEGTLRRVGFDEMRRIIREDEPPRPSRRVSTLAAEQSTTVADRRGVDVRRLGRLMRNELDWVVMRALEKDRDRRYESAGAFAADVERYLGGRAIEAVPPSAWYRLRKFARRNRAALTFATAFAVLLAASTAASAWLAVRATRAETQATADRDTAVAEKNRANDEAASAQAMLNFLGGDLIGQADPLAHTIPTPDLKLRTVFDRAAKRIEGRFADRPLAEARLRAAIAQAYFQLAEHSASLVHAERAHELYLRTAGPKDKRTLEQLRRVGMVYWALGRYPEAEKRFEEGLETARREFGDDDTVTLGMTLGRVVTLTDSGRFDDAAALIEPALELSRARWGPGAGMTQNLERRLVELYLTQRKAREAEPVIARLVDVATRDRERGPLHTETLARRYLQGLCYFQLRHYERAKEVFARLVDDSRKTLGPDHAYTSEYELNLARLYVLRGKSPEAERLLTAMLEAGRRIQASTDLTAGDPSLVNRMLTARLDLGFAYHEQGQYTRAEPLLIEALEGYKRVLGPNSFPACMGRWSLARNLMKQGRYAEAEPLLVEAVDLLQRGRDRKNYFTALFKIFLGWNRINQGHFEAAEPPLREALAVLEEVTPDTFEHYAARSFLGRSLAGQKKYDQAEPLQVQGYEGMRQRAWHFPPQEHHFGEAAGWLVELYEATGDKAKAAEWRVERARHQRELAPPPR